MSGTVAAIDVVAADDGPRELLRKKVQLVGCLRAAEQAESVRSALLDRAGYPSRGPVECLIPCRNSKAIAVAHHRFGQARELFFHKVGCPHKSVATFDEDRPSDAPKVLVTRNSWDKPATNLKQHSPGRR